jgi:hypothetical protein
MLWASFSVRKEGIGGESASEKKCQILGKLILWLFSGLHVNTVLKEQLISSLFLSGTQLLAGQTNN